MPSKRLASSWSSTPKILASKPTALARLFSTLLAENEREPSSALGWAAVIDPVRILAAEGGSNFLEQELSVVVLLAIAAAMAIIVQRIKVPYTVALVIVGLAFAFFPNFVDIDFSPELILGLLIPPLLFEATLHLPWKKLRADLFPVLLFAIGGTMLGTFAVGGIVWWLVGVPWLAAVAFGALVSATDPVAVIAFFKQLGVTKRLSVLVEGESLFNDAVAFVAFTLAVTAAKPGETFTIGKAIGDFVIVGGGGLAVGIVLGWFVSQVVLARVDDALIETTTTLALAYGSFLVAEEFGLIIGVDGLHFSGILAVVAAGLMVGTYGLVNTSPTTRITLEYFWEVLAFLVNSLVFLVIGLKINLREIDFAENALNVVVAIAVILVVRFVIVYGFGAIHSRLQPSRRVPRAFSHVMYWGGLRGAISLALALLLEKSDFAPEVVDTLLVMTFGVVLFTLLIQGTTISALISRLGLSGQEANERHQQELQARIYANRAGAAEIARLGNEGVLFSSMSKAMQATYEADVATARSELSSHFSEHPELEVAMLLQARRDALVAEQTAIGEMVRSGFVSSDVGHHIAVEINNRMAALELIEDRWESNIGDPPGKL